MLAEILRFSVKLLTLRTCHQSQLPQAHPPATVSRPQASVLYSADLSLSDGGCFAVKLSGWHARLNEALKQLPEARQDPVTKTRCDI